MTITHRRILYAISTAYVILAGIYSIVTPPFEASDELWHYPMIQYLATHGLQLPPQDPANPGPWRQEGSQPPLYYMIGAVLTSGIDTSDMDSLRRLNPHPDIGIVRPDGNANIVVHRQDAEAFPWHGTALAVHIVRFFSLLLGLGTVLVTYQLAREIFPEQPMIAVGAAAMNAFLPMFLFISGSINNDNLSNFLGNLLLLLIVRLVRVTPGAKAAWLAENSSPLKGLEESAKEQNNPDSQSAKERNIFANWQEYALIGVVAGAGLLAKLNIGFLIPLVAGALLVVSVWQRDWRPLVIGGLISGVLTVVIAGWWYLRNQQLYGDPTGLAMFLDIVKRRAIPATPAQLWSERNSFTEAYWGFFGGVNVLMPDVVYLVFNIIGGLALISAVIFIGYTVIWRKWSWTQWLRAAVTVIWPVVTFISYLRWTAETEASQGRLIFGALSAISMWMAVGLVWRLPKKIQLPVMSGGVAYFAVVAVLAPFLVIAPAYVIPPQISTQPPSAVFSDVTGTGQIGLMAAKVLTPTVQPEDYAQIEVDWEIVQPTTRDESIFVHLMTPDGVIVGQRDIYPGEGKLATSDLSAGRAWANPIAIVIPPAAYTPITLTVSIGWYDLVSGQRMTLADGKDTLDIGQLQLAPREDNLGVPNPIRVNFDNQIELVGYALSNLSPKPGESVDLTLYWRGLKKLSQNYVVFAHILDPQSESIYAGSDGMPVNWNAPTSTWEPGKIIEDTHTLTVKDDAPPGIYELEIGLYLQQPDNTFPRLSIVAKDGGTSANYFYLNRVRIAGANGN